MKTLVHIGWPKTGTTWLQERFFVEALGYSQVLQRDDITRHFVLPDQLDFDPRVVRRALEAALSSADQQGLCPVLSHERLAGVFRSHLESIVFGQRLIASLDDMAVLIVVREQRNAMLAAWQQYVRGGGAPATGPAVRSLVDYYGNEETRESLLPPLGDLNYFRYDRLASWYRNELGPERVLVLPLEQLRHDPLSFQQRIHQFALGRDRPERAAVDPVNSAWAPVTYGLKRRLNYVGDRRRLPVSSSSPYWIARSMSDRFDEVVPPKARQLGHLRQVEIIEKIAGDSFVESNQRLASMVTWDPQNYGYMA